MKTKKLILNKNTVKRLNVQTNLQTGVPADNSDPGYTYTCGASCSGSIKR